MLLVTGITGHSGKYFLQRLIAAKYPGKIRCVARKESNIAVLQESGLDIEIVWGDLLDASFIRQIMEDVHTVMHIYNIHHSVNIVKAAIENNVSRAILVHTTGIYSKYKTASAQYKQIESEVMKLAEHNITLTILRPSMIYGDMCDHNMSKFIKMIYKLKIIPLINGGRSLIQPVNARDLGNAYYDVLINPGITANKQYDITGEEPVSIKEALTVISEILNKKTVFIPVSLNVSLFAAYLFKFLTIGRIDLVEKVLRMAEDRAYSHETAKRDFNFSPMSFTKGIEMEINEFRQRYFIQ